MKARAHVKCNFHKMSDNIRQEPGQLLLKVQKSFKKFPRNNILPPNVSMDRWNAVLTSPLKSLNVFDEWPNIFRSKFTKNEESIVFREKIPRKSPGTRSQTCWKVLSKSQENFRPLSNMSEQKSTKLISLKLILLRRTMKILYPRRKFFDEWLKIFRSQSKKEHESVFE